MNVILNWIQDLNNLDILKSEIVPSQHVNHFLSLKEIIVGPPVHPPISLA
jgi:hypothetical protein